MVKTPKDAYQEVPRDALRSGRTRLISVLEAATLPPRKLTKADKEAITSAGQRMLVQELSEALERALRLGLPITANAITTARNACGWEILGNLEAARRGRPI